MNLNTNNKQIISEGTYGIVYSFIDNNHKFIKKEYRKAKGFLTGIPDDLIREVFHYSQPYSKINLYEFGKDYIILDQFSSDLYGFIRDKKYIGLPEDLSEIKRQILLQIYVTHSYGFLHSDIKISNILYNATKNIYSLCDYGLTEFYGFPSIKKRYQCTSYFKPHKTLIRNTINLDIYSLGCVLYYLEGGLEKGYTKNVMKNSISDETYQLLTMKSAKNLLNIYLSDSGEEYISKIFKKLDILEDHDIPFEIYNKSIFIDYSVKNEMYNTYTFGQGGNEIEYLDDMYFMYCSNPILFGSTSKNCIKNKIKILEKYLESQISLESLFLSWLLVSMHDIDSDSYYKIVLNFSCKILEYYSYKVSVDGIVDKEIELLKLFFEKKIVFTPTIFFLYYYLFNIAKRASSDFYSKVGRLEGLGLSFLLLFFINPKKYVEELTYNGLTMDILDMSIEYQFNSKIVENKELFDLCKLNSNYLSVEILRKIICDKSMLENLIQNR